MGQEALGVAAVTLRLRAAGCVFAEEEAELLVAAGTDPARLETLVERRELGAPLEHVLGWGLFAGRRVLVEPGVFVPRRRTELLARTAASAAAAVVGHRPVVVDLCCGSGAIGAVVADSVGDLELHAVDADPLAVGCARRNLPDDAVVAVGDLYAGLPGDLAGRVDVLAANAPYVPTGELDLMPAEARLHEPGLALDGGPDGLDVHRRIALDAPRWLAPAGRLLIEVGEDQLTATRRILGEAGLRVRVLRSAALDARVVVGALTRRPRLRVVAT
ncbi:MAG TPA: putative protein N(5)-glutamine methyltransferase [Actinomycetes bacterium]|nr:putative protein N(5)-glutamine methyltransferase [Actinomycetes bacterium]